MLAVLDLSAASSVVVLGTNHEKAAIANGLELLLRQGRLRLAPQLFNVKSHEIVCGKAVNLPTKAPDSQDASFTVFCFCLLTRFLSTRLPLLSVLFF